MSNISIIVPCFNQGEYLDECLNSVFHQTFFDWECIIINDGSSDITSIQAMKWVNKDNRFKYFEIENGGLCNARNYGVKNSNGLYILPLDADDRISNNYLESCLNAIEQEIDIKIVYGKAFKFGMINEYWNLEPYSFDKLLEFNMIYCSAIFRKKDFIDVGGYDLNLKYGLEDWDLWINLLKNGGNVMQVESAYFYYRIKENSMINDLVSSKNRLDFSKRYIFKKYKTLYMSDEYEFYKSYKSIERALEIYNKRYRFLNYIFKNLKILLKSCRI